MKIGMIGTGNVGSALGRGLASQGHSVTFGVRNTSSPDARNLAASLGASLATVEECARLAEVIFLAVPWDAAIPVVRSMGNLGGKILVDCTNPLDKDLEGLVVGTTISAAEEIARAASGARVVKCFNTTGAKNMGQTRYGSQSIDAYLCGDDAEAKRTVASLASSLGFEVVDCGPLRAARYTEPFAMLWIHLCVKQGMGPDIAFKLLKR